MDTADQTVELTDYEKKQLDLIKAWEIDPPSVISQSVGKLLQPIVWLARQIIPDSVIESLLHAADWMAEASISEQTALPVEGASLEELDKEADNVQNWAIGYGTAEGGVAGIVGLASLPADIPAVITLALRTIRRVGRCYGYGGDGEDEKQFVLNILAAAGANTIEEKAAAMVALRSIQTILLKTTWKAMGQKAMTSVASKEGIILVIRDLAKQLGVNLTKRKALAAIPVIGAIVGASVNAWYLRDIGLAAQRAYQERWLKDHGKLIDQ